MSSILGLGGLALLWQNSLYEGLQGFMVGRRQDRNSVLAKQGETLHVTHLDSFCEMFMVGRRQDRGLQGLWLVEDREECGSHDLGFSGYEFIWENRRGDGEVVEERLDRFCGTIEWSLNFPEAEVFFLDEHYSDHLPVYFLKLQEYSFKTDHHDESCKDVVQAAWEGATMEDARTCLDQKVSLSSRALLEWNENVFGDVKKHFRRLELRLKGEKDIIVLHRAWTGLGEWRRKKEILWAESAKCNYLKYGDSNSLWFHACASMRRPTKSIAMLERADGTLIEEEGTRDMDQVLSHATIKVTSEMKAVLSMPYSELEVSRL
ncbi:LOW QUALITY PROTEIN: hypothetical protein Cgig2_022851 [Carnegiea gigantea]|uniref:Uncharacterized protein n=1 Tax=Carnegiea gigantea TaxID=171969 RepID=A0A9Q1KR07_9CARY|nr:LOW QUALITY PROTEIN: hypothetical protein Cgig2_022851 [Carnegiea gigantea]